MQSRRIALPYPSAEARYAYAECLLGEAWPVLLDSGGAGGEKGRYDIVSAAPRTMLTTRGAVTRIVSDGKFAASAEDPFMLVQQALGTRRQPFPDLPFAGGALGYFSYDLGRRVERLPALAQTDIALPDMAIGIYDWAVVIDHGERAAWLVSPDGLDDEQWKALVERFHKPRDPALPAFRLATPWQSNMDRTAYGQAFRRIQEYIRAGDCYQVNLAQRFSAEFEGHPWRAYRQLAAANQGPFSAYLQLPEGAILSISPERFLRVQDDLVVTEPIKGTRPRVTGAEDDARLAEELRTSPKDRAENLMIVDLLRNDIGKTCAIGSVRVPELFGVYSFPAVHHLISTVTGRLPDGRSALDLLRGAFPGGSITGAPKVRAMEIIEELEPVRRNVYCGAIGYIGYDGNMDTNIAIRTLVCENGRIHAWAGGGLVADSDEEAEYRETFHKLAKILPVLDSP